MKETIDYLIKLSKFSGFCLVAVLFSKYMVIKIEHKAPQGEAIRISHEGFHSPHVKIDVDNTHTGKYGGTLNLMHSGYCKMT